jgi:hypothetical protein
MGWASKGFDAGEEQAKKFGGGFTRDFFLKDGETVVIRVIEPESFNIRSHFVKGKGNFTCGQGVDGEDCPLCERGYKATNQYVFQVFDPREFEDSQGKKHDGGVKTWRTGIRMLRNLKKLSNKFGALNTFDIEVSRSGSGQDTQYTVLPEMDTLGTDFELPEGFELYDLEEVMQPKARTDLIRLMSDVAPEEDDEDDAKDDDDDDGYDFSKERRSSRPRAGHSSKRR